MLREVIVAAVVAFASAAHAQATFGNYLCDDGSQLAVMAVPTTRALYIQLDGHALTLPKRLGLRVQRYSKGGVSVVLSGGSATLRRPRKATTHCSAS